MPKQSAYVKSNYPRIPGDYYPTIDPRCTWGFLEWFRPAGLVVDPCAPNGSGIVTTLQECGLKAEGLPDAFADFVADWIVTNPPYGRELVDLPAGWGMKTKRGPDGKLPLVDAIIWAGIRAVEAGKVRGAAYLVRSTFDHAKSRADMFESRYYEGQIKLRFRPWWSEDRSKQPIHNYVWHIWTLKRYYPGPAVLYADGLPPVAGVVG